MKDSEGVETFEHCFLMKECDLMKNPPPSFVWLGKKKLRVRYKGQIPTCFICDAEDHLVHGCPKKKRRQPTPSSSKQSEMYNKEFPGLNNEQEQRDTTEKKHDNERTQEKEGKTMENYTQENDDAKTNKENEEDTRVEVVNDTDEQATNNQTLGTIVNNVLVEGEKKKRESKSTKKNKMDLRNRKKDKVVNHESATEGISSPDTIGTSNDNTGKNPQVQRVDEHGGG